MNRTAMSLIVANFIGWSQILPNFTAAQQAPQTTPAPAAAPAFSTSRLVTGAPIPASSSHPRTSSSWSLIAGG